MVRTDLEHEKANHGIFPGLYLNIKLNFADKNSIKVGKFAERCPVDRDGQRGGIEARDWSTVIYNTISLVKIRLEVLS